MRFLESTFSVGHCPYTATPPLHASRLATIGGSRLKIISGISYEPVVQRDAERPCVNVLLNEVLRNPAKSVAGDCRRGNQIAIIEYETRLCSTQGILKLLARGESDVFSEGACRRLESRQFVLVSLPLDFGNPTSANSGAYTTDTHFESGTLPFIPL
jgi:hypothetical protein